MGSKVAYGLRCDARFDWPWAPAATGTGPIDLQIELGTLGPYASYAERDYTLLAKRARDTPGAEPVVGIHRGADGHHRVRYADGAVFVVEPSLTRLYGITGPKLTLDDLIVYLQGPVLGLLLRLKGVTCLHASAVVVDGRALVLVGDGGMGKSTSAACFARMGLPVLTDDVLALDLEPGRIVARSGLPRLMLWEESVQALWGSADALPLVVAGWEKRYLDLNQPGYRFAAQAVPLGAIYLLWERRAADAAPEIAPVAGTDALMSLVANTYGNDLLDLPRRVQELDVLSRVVNDVPVRRLLAPANRAALPAICAALLEDFAGAIRR